MSTTTTTMTNPNIMAPQPIRNIRNMQYDTEFPTFREKLRDLITRGFLTLTPWTKINMDFGIKLRLPDINFNNFVIFARSYLEEIANHPDADPMFEILFSEIVEILLPFMNTQFQIQFTNNHILTPDYPHVKYIIDDNIANMLVGAKIWTASVAHYFHMQRMYI